MCCSVVTQSELTAAMISLSLVLTYRLPLMTATHTYVYRDAYIYRIHTTGRVSRIQRKQWDKLQHRTAYCNTLQHTATHCNTLQHTATHRRESAADPTQTVGHTATHCNTLQHTATHCNTVQLTASHCNTLQHTATHCTTQQGGFHQSNANSGTNCEILRGPLPCNSATATNCGKAKTNRHFERKNDATSTLRLIIRNMIFTSELLVTPEISSL